MNLAGFKVVRRLIVAHAWAHPGRVLFTTLSDHHGRGSCRLGGERLRLVGRQVRRLCRRCRAVPVVPCPAGRGTQFGGNGPPGGGDRGLSPEILERLAHDPDVAAVDPVFQSRARIENPLQPPQDRQGRRGPGAQAKRRRSRRRSAIARAGTAAAMLLDSSMTAPPARLEDGAPPTPAEATQMMARFCAQQTTLVGHRRRRAATFAGRWSLAGYLASGKVGGSDHALFGGTLGRQSG